MPTKLEDKVFALFLPLITGKGSIQDPVSKVRNVILKQQIDIENCNETNLLVEAIRAHSDLAHPMIKMLAEIVGSAAFDRAKLLAASSIDGSAQIVDAPPADDITEEVEEETEPAAAAQAPEPVIRTIWDAVGDNGDDLQAIIADMMAKGGDINEKKDEYSAIQTAALNGFRKAVETLHKSGADLDGVDIAALFGGNEGVLAYLTEQGLYTPEDLTLKAAKSDEYTDAFETLLATLPGGVKVYLSETGLNGLHVATKAGATDNMNKAIDLGIPVESQTKNERLTSLQLAVIDGQKGSLDTLITRKADPFVEEETTGATILHLAARVNNPEIAAAIIGPDSALDPDIRLALAKQVDKTGANAFHTASACGAGSVMDLMTKTLPEAVVHELINAQDRGGRSVLSMATTEEMKQLLKDHGAQEQAAAPAEEESDAVADLPVAAAAPSTPIAKPKALYPQTPASAMKLPLGAKTVEISPLGKLIMAVNDNNVLGVKDALRIATYPQQLLKASLSIKFDGQTAESTEKDESSNVQDCNILFFARAFKKQATLDAMTDIWADANWKTLMLMLSSNNGEGLTALLDNPDTQYLRDAKFTITTTKKESAGYLVGSNGIESVWVNFTDSLNKSTLLHAAATLSTDPGMIGILVERGLNINDQDINGYTPIHYAVERGHVEIANAFKDSGADLGLINSGEHKNPVEIAAYLGDREMFFALLDNDNTKISYPHLRHAIHGKKADMISAILSLRPDFSPKCVKITGKNALMEAIETGDINTFKAVLESSPSNIMLHQNTSKQHVLHSIAMYGTLSMLIEVMQNHKEIFNGLTPLKDIYGNTPLHLAATREEVVYQELKEYLSTHTIIVKSGPFGLMKKSVTKNITAETNKAGQTADTIHSAKIAADHEALAEGQAALSVKAAAAAIQEDDDDQAQPAAAEHDTHYNPDVPLLAQDADA